MNPEKETTEVVFCFMGYNGLFNKNNNCYELFNPHGVLIYTFNCNDDSIEYTESVGMDKVLINGFEKWLISEGVMINDN